MGNGIREKWKKHSANRGIGDESGELPKDKNPQTFKTKVRKGTKVNKRRR